MFQKVKQVRLGEQYNRGHFIYELLGSMDMEVVESQPSTHGPRGSRREEWRKSKGMPIRPAVKGVNRQGDVVARRKAGRAKRRR
jgi:hypothetical protein